MDCGLGPNASVEIPSIKLNEPEVPDLQAIPLPTSPTETKTHVFEEGYFFSRFPAPPAAAGVNIGLALSANGDEVLLGCHEPVAFRPLTLMCELWLLNFAAGLKQHKHCCLPFQCIPNTFYFRNNMQTHAATSKAGAEDCQVEHRWVCGRGRWACL